MSPLTYWAFGLLQRCLQLHETTTLCALVKVLLERRALVTNSQSLLNKLSRRSGLFDIK